MNESISTVHIGSVFSFHDGSLSLAAHAGSTGVNTTILKTAMPRPRAGTGEVLSDGPSAVLAGVEKGSASTAIGIPSAALIAGRIAPGAALVGGVNDAINVGQHVVHGAGAEAMTEGLGVAGQAGGAVAGAEMGLWLLTPFAVVLGPAAPPIGAFLGGVGGAFVGAQGAKSIGAYLTGGDTPDKLGPPLTLPNDTALAPTVTTSNGSQYSLVQIEGRYTWFSIQDNPALPHRFVEVVSGAKAAELTGDYLQAAGFEAQLAQAHAQLAQQQREALREAFFRSEIQSANNAGPNGLPWGTPSAIGTNATQTWLQSPQPGQALNILEVRNADGSVSRIEQEVDRASGMLLGEKSYENPHASKADGFRLVATSDYLSGVHWTLNRETGVMEQAGIAPGTSGGPASKDGFAPDGSPLGQAATVIHEGTAYTTVWTRDAASGHYSETETIAHRDSAGKDMAPTTIVRSYGADGTALTDNTSQVPAQPESIPRITTHEQRITPTPGGMRFAEAHKRRDEPEQISPGSLQPVGKPDAANLDKGSLLYRTHQANEQDLMRSLGVAQAQDRERFKHEPSPQRPSLDRTQQRTPTPLLDAAPVQKQPAPVEPVAAHTMAPSANHSAPANTSAATQERLAEAARGHEQETARQRIDSPPSAQPPATPSRPEPRIDHPDHPGHALFQQVREHMCAVDARMGRSSDQHTDNVAACLAVKACRSGFDRIDYADIADDGKNFCMAQGPLMTFRMKVETVPFDSAMVPIEQTSPQWQEAQQFAQQQQAEQQQAQAQAQQQRHEQQQRQAQSPQGPTL